MARRPARLAPPGRDRRVAAGVDEGIGPIVDALNLANEIDGHVLYRCRSVRGTAAPCRSRAARSWPADAAFGDAIACDWLIVVSERYQQFADYRLFLASLARVGQRTPLVTGIHHGVWWLAMAGQLSALSRRA